MAHIHEKIDFTVSAYIVHPKLDKILLIHHKKFNRWLQIGGHVQLDEDTDTALMREITEETGLEVELLSEKPGKAAPNEKVLYRPDFMNIHEINSPRGHMHLDLRYVAIAKTTEPKLAPDEHNEIRWFTRHDLYTADFGLTPADRWHCLEALKMAKAHHVI